MKVFQLFLFLFVFQLNAQSNWKEFWIQSYPIKSWTVIHPFKAKKARLISFEAIRVADSIAKTNLLDGDKFGGRVDAFRHGYWMARLNQEIGKCASLSLGRAYERSNKKSFRKSRRKGEESSYDLASKKMDLFNNKIGVTFTKKKQSVAKSKLIFQIVNSIKLGKFKILKKDSLGGYISCNNVVVSKEILNEWNNRKCLIDSNYK